MTRRILITIEYDGAPFSGWQRQDNADSVQARIEDAAAAFLLAPVEVAGAGRTDSRGGRRPPTEFASPSHAREALSYIGVTKVSS